MERKKWTPKSDTDAASIKLRDKRRWQIALRRYVVHQQPSAMYAPFFGIHIAGFRQWIALHFAKGMSWDNFGTLWQFDHIIPVTHFDFNDDNDMTLCWNFVNIRIDGIETSKNKSAGLDILNTQAYFEALHQATGWHIISQLLKKLEQIGAVETKEITHLAAFINHHKTLLNHLSGFDAHDFLRINQGDALEELLAEKALFSRFQ